MDHNTDHNERPAGVTILAIYLGLTALLLPAVPSVLVRIAHVAGLLLVVYRIRVGRDTALDLWLPLAAVPFLYAELPSLMPVLGGSFHDQAVRSWEVAVFGISPAATLASRMPSAALSELLHLGYLAYYPIIYVPPLALFLAGRRREMAATVSGLMATYAVCFIVFVVFPVEGPRYEWGSPAGIPDGWIRRFTLGLLNAGASRGAAFPSSHVAVAVAQSVMALHWQPRLGRVVAITTSLLAVGAVYGGFHYGVDALAGGGVGLAAGVIAIGILGDLARGSKVDIPPALDASYSAPFHEKGRD